MITPTRSRRPGGLEDGYVEQGLWDQHLLTEWAPPPTGDTHPAIIDGAVTLDYGELRRVRDAVVDGLRRRGVGTGDVVTVELPNWWEAAVIMHATVALAGVVNPVVPIYRDSEVGFIVRQASAAVVCVPHRFRGFDYVAMLQRLLPDLARRPLVVVVRAEGPLPAGFIDFRELLAEQAGPSPGIGPAHSSDICLLLYTSGTTAEAKGVLHSHDTLRYENRSMVELLDLGPADTVFMASPVTHITGFLYGILLPPMLGSTVVYLDVWDPEAAADLIEAHQCRFTVGATPFLQGLVDTYRRRGGPAALRVFPCGGADVPPELVRQGRSVLGCAVMRIYGSSEFPTYSCSPPDGDEWIAAETDGLPIGPVQHRIEGPEGQPGELLLRGPELFLGYLDPQLNAEAFSPDGWFRTGDLATEDRGGVTIRGRSKDIIIRGGENISAKQIEDCLYQHPSVREVAVVAMPDARMGEKGCAFVVPEGDPPTLEALCAFLEAARIARQKFPEHLEIIDELPKTASGKVQKYLLRQWAASA